jgi:hypothetical protein
MRKPLAWSEFDKDAKIQSLKADVKRALNAAEEHESQIKVLSDRLEQMELVLQRFAGELYEVGKSAGMGWTSQ